MRAVRICNKDGRGGYSLVEVLVSIAVLTILVLVLMQLVGSTFRIFSLGVSQKDTLQNLRAISHLLQNNLEGAVLPVNPANQSSLQFVEDPSAISSVYENPDAIFWQSALGTDSSVSSIVGVGYFLFWDTSNATNPQGKLCRLYLDSSSPTLSDYQSYCNGSWLSSNPNNFISTYAPGTQAQNYKGLLAENVIGFWVHFEAVDNMGNPVTLSSPFNSRIDQRLPTAAVLSFAFVSPATARRITPGDVTIIQGLYSQYDPTHPTTSSLFLAGLPAAIKSDTRFYTTRVLFNRSN